MLTSVLCCHIYLNSILHRPQSNELPSGQLGWKRNVYTTSSCQHPPTHLVFPCKKGLPHLSIWWPTGSENTFNFFFPTGSSQPKTRRTQLIRVQKIHRVIVFLISRIMSLPFVSLGSISEESLASSYLTSKVWGLLDRAFLWKETFHSSSLIVSYQPLCEWDGSASPEVMWLSEHQDCPSDSTLPTGKYKALGSRRKQKASHWASH